MMRKRLLMLVIACLALAMVSAGWILSRRPSAETAAALKRVVTNRNALERGEVSFELLARGEEALPSLASALKARDGSMDEHYRRWRNRLPPTVREHFPERPEADEVRGAVAESIRIMGPAASRALVGAIGVALEIEGADPDIRTSMELLRALYWSIPDSPKAVQILSNWLAHPAPGRELFGSMLTDDLWPTVPQLAPLLPGWLKLADTAREAAGALPLMGTNAVFAIPQLIEVARDGAAGGASNAVLHTHYTPELEANIIPWNRAAAMGALGTLGAATPDVLTVLQKGIADENPMVRAGAANGLGLLGDRALPVLPYLIEHLDETHHDVLAFQLEAIGRMGPGAAASATPVLLRFSDLSLRPPDSPPLMGAIRYPGAPADPRLAAAIALGQVNPEAAQTRLELMVGALHGLVESNQVVRLRPMRKDLLPLLTNDMGAIVMRNVLALDPQNSAVAEITRREMETAQDLSLRTTMALINYWAAGEAEPVLAVFDQALDEVKDHQTQTPLTVIRDLGPVARALGPKVARFLHHEDQILRMLAGRALKVIAPEALPPVNEN